MAQTLGNAARRRVISVAAGHPRPLSIGLRQSMAVEMVTDWWDGARNTESVITAPTWEMVSEAIKGLDGNVRTLVTIVLEPLSHMTIGGGGDNGLYIVQATEDGERFHLATREDVTSPSNVTIKAGGQNGDFPARRCVDLDTALRAAETFVETGQLETAIKWEA